VPPLECPNCRLLNVETATRCDCGFDFAANRRPGRHVPFLSLPNVRKALVVAAGGIAGVVFIEPPVRILCIWATVAGLGLLARGAALRRRTPLGEQPGEDWPITGLTFDSTGWRLRDATMDRMSWERANADTLSLWPWGRRAPAGYRETPAEALAAWARSLAGRVIPVVSRTATPLPTFVRRTGRLRGRRLRVRSGRGPVATTR
jgi:hypothetical protein